MADRLYPQAHSDVDTPVSPALPDFPLPASRVSSAQFPRLSSSRSDATTIVTQLPHHRTMLPQSPSPSPSSVSNSSAFTHQAATPANVHPSPAYVAAFGASQVVNEGKRHFSDDEDEEDIGVTRSSRSDTEFSPASLSLLNGFLDQLLYSILLTAKSTTLTALRPAVAEVLRSRLAAEAIASAEEELSELLAGGDEEEEEMNQKQSVAERKRKWDTELVWKRTRLRVMVYIRLGEMEDEDEERYVMEDDLFAGSERRFSHSSGLVSWAAAIFLTSILEYMAEQVLQVAGHAAYARVRRQARHPGASMSASGRITPSSDVTVEDYDMEKVALNSAIGRLWRTWRKSLRSNHPLIGPAPIPIKRGSTSASRFSRDKGGPENMSLRQDSFDESPQAEKHTWEGPPEVEYPEYILAANIPLPMVDGKRDVEEIQTPWLAHYPDTDSEVDGDQTPSRVLSMRRGSWAVSSREDDSTKNRPRAASIPVSCFRLPDVSETADRTPEIADSIHPEPKAKVADMILHKRKVSLDKSLLSNEHDRPPTSRSEQEREKHTDESENPRSLDSPVSDAQSNTDETDEDDEMERPRVMPSNNRKSWTHISEGRRTKRLSLTQSVLVRTTSSDDSSHSKEEGGMGQEEESGQARDHNYTSSGHRRRSRILLADVPEKRESHAVGIPEPPEQDTTTTSPEQFLKRRSLAARPTPVESTPRVLSYHESPHSSLRPSTCATSSDMGDNGSVSPLTDKAPSPWRQSFSTTVKEASTLKKRGLTPEPAGSIQKHPVVAKMSGSKSGGQIRDEPDEINLTSLTSASIRGPEDFEMFVQGGDTVKYTLTPESVRDHSTPPEAVTVIKASRSRDRRGSIDTKKPSPLSSPIEETRTGRSAVSRSATGANAGGDDYGRPPTSGTEHRRSISRPLARNISVHRKSGMMPREPQVLTDSTRDFADFIRSTGPTKEPEVRPLLSHRSTTSLASLRDAHIAASRSHSPGATKARSMSRGAIDPQDIPPVPPMPTNTYPRMMPREAKSNGEYGTAELIDFIRSGPHGNGEGSLDPKHRISRSIAPFRTTMDSDRLEDWSDVFAVQPSLHVNTDVPPANNTMSPSSSNTYRTSANSRSTLLNQAAAGNDAHAVQPPPSAPKSVFPAGSKAQKVAQKLAQQRKDPYYIDYSDDEDEDEDDDDDDLLTALPGKKRNEESLMDFLRNTTPPPPTGHSRAPSVQSNKSIPRHVPGLQTFGADAIGMGHRGSIPNRDSPTPKHGSYGSAAIAQGPMTKPRPKLETRDNTDFGVQNHLTDDLRTASPQTPRTLPTNFPTMHTSRSNSKTSVAMTSMRSTSTMKKSRFNIFGGGGLFSRGGRKAYLDM